MKVLNLRCSRQHSFEGWFGSEDDFQRQLKRGLIECPLCADSDIQKLPSSPRLNLGAQQIPDSDSSTLDQTAHAPSSAATSLKNDVAFGDLLERDRRENLNPAAQSSFLNALRQVVATAEDVGKRFAEEARRMHYGEVQARSIRGQASAREAVELLEEGIEVMPLPMLPALKETLQ
ncbi:MAG: DUF1178 family protein [Polaromonas sp.]